MKPRGTWVPRPTTLSGRFQEKYLRGLSRSLVRNKKTILVNISRKGIYWKDTREFLPSMDSENRAEPPPAQTTAQGVSGKMQRHHLCITTVRNGHRTFTAISLCHFQNRTLDLIAAAATARIYSLCPSLPLHCCLMPG